MLFETYTAELRQRRSRSSGFKFGRFEIGAAVFLAGLCWLGIHNIKFFPLNGAERCSQFVRCRVDQNRYNRIRLREVDDGFPSQGPTHEASPDRGADGPARKARSSRSWLVIANPDPRDDLGGVADEPGIPIIVCCTGLPGGLLLKHETFQCFGGAVSEDVLQHLGRHKGGGRREDQGDGRGRFRPGLALAIIDAEDSPGLGPQATSCKGGIS